MRPFLPAVAAVAFLLAAPAFAQDLKVTRADATSVTLTSEALADLPRSRVTVAGGSGPQVYEGPALAYVMRAARLPVGMRAHGEPMKGYLVVRGADGYAAVLSAAEADKELHEDVVILADRLDGQPLPEAEGPWRLVIDDDIRPWRSVRQVVAMDYRLAD
ncbi:molybdopterin-dependent oxidoreductase [Phenylobacterium sp.]|uniref:molybdopterin-dependent oxidoreductase n=1 Tax=Phenylobacterium sp. TaxID=1871053 RepID=UPI001999A877|nr:molybdopterin-dependent oxidoreductase [Phenylobacterium sp.]MBC7167278.1 molybdopterin-dependent oxidoreductase [Phenylobacterium sp.]